MTDSEAPPPPGGEPSIDATDVCVPSDRGDTVATLLHDLNQPLTALTNFLAAAQIAAEQQPTCVSVAGLIDAAESQAGRARLIVRRLRDHLAH